MKNEQLQKKMQPGRLLEVDSIKMVFVLIVILIHTTIECTSDEGLCSGFPYLVDTVIGGPLAAPPLMFCMGICILYSRKKEAKVIFRRGLGLFGMGFMLNICRYTIPYLIGYGITRDYAKYIDPIWYRTFCNDIFQFAGLALCIIAILIHLQISDLEMFLFALACSVLGTCLNGTDVGNPLGNIALGYLIGTEDAAGKVFSDFVLLNWLIVPVCGYLFGKRLKHATDKAAFYRRISPACIVISVIYFIVGIKGSLGMFGEGENCYYHIVTWDALACVVTAVGLLGIHYAIDYRLPDVLMQKISHIGQLMTKVYCIHWVLLVYIVNLGMYMIRGTQELAFGKVVLLSILIMVLSLLLADLWSQRGKENWRKGDRLKNEKRTEYRNK